MRQLFRYLNLQQFPNSKIWGNTVFFTEKKSMKSHSYRWLASGNTGFLSLTVLLHRSWFFNYVGWDHFLWRLRRWCWRLRPGQSGQPFPSDLKIEIPMQCFDRKKIMLIHKKFHATKINKNLILLEVNRTNLFSRIWKSNRNFFAAIFWQKIPFVFVSTKLFRL